MRTFHLFKSQTAFLDHDPYWKAICFAGGYGSGKSFILTLKMIQTKIAFPQCDLLYITPVFSNLRDILIPTLTEILTDTNIRYKVNKTTGEIFFDKGGRIIVKSGDNPDSIIGINVKDVFLDELDTISKGKATTLWNKSIARARQQVPMLNDDGTPVIHQDGSPKNYPNHIYVASTPEGYSFLYEMFVKRKPENYLLIKASSRENRHISPDYVNNLIAIYPESLVRSYIDGEFTNLTSGTVYNFNREIHNSSELYQYGEPLHVGIDFNVLGISAVIYVKRSSLNDQGKSIPNYTYNSSPTLHAVDHLQKVQDTPQLIEILQEKYPASHISCYPDASGKNTSTKGVTISDISILKQAGFSCKYPTKNPAIMNRVLATNSAFKNGLLKVNIDRCEDLAEAFEQQVYSEKTEMPEKNSGAGTIDDITDSATYIIHYLYPVKRKTFRSKNTKTI